MITIQDWIATIPEEEKHIAFVGEHQSVTRTFLLTGSNWENYKDWGFHLDMAFDLSSVTSRAQREMESTQVSNTENITDTQIKQTGTTKKERYSVTEVEVDCAAKTDIASLKKKVREDGVLLTWTVLRQHTQLPGKLRATLRALGPDGQVKKSELMVFEVEPAVVAEAAADIPQSEFEAMEENMDEMLVAVLQNAQMVEIHMEDIQKRLGQMEDIQAHAETILEQVNTLHNKTTLTSNKMNEAVKKVEAETERVLVFWPPEDEGFDLVFGNNLLNLHHVIYNKGQLANGLVGNDPSKNLALTGYIPVKEGDVLAYQRTDAETGQRILGSLYAVCLFDEHKEVNQEANQYKANEDGRLHAITIPAGVSYVRLTLHDLDTAVDPAIAPCQELIPYERYQPVRKLKAEGYDAACVEQTVQPVRYEPQSLTLQQQAQARANIGSASTDAIDGIQQQLLWATGKVQTLLQTVGDVDTALDRILDIQEAYIGGEGA